MNENRMYEGLENQARWEEDLIARFGEAAEAKIVESKKRFATLGPEEIAAHQEQMNVLLGKLAAALDRGDEPASAAVQALTAEHHAWVSVAWTPDARAYAGLGQLYVESEDFRKVYEERRAGLAAFLAEAMRVYAERVLSPGKKS